MTHVKEGLPAPERRQHGTIHEGERQGTHGAEWAAESTGWADAEVEGDGEERGGTLGYDGNILSG